MKVKSFIKGEIVFIIALAAALISAIFNPHPSSWLNAIDFRTLILLFSLMGISEGLKATGFFDSISAFMMEKSKKASTLSLALLFTVFFTSMFFTNDVSLLMFVPFSAMLLDREGLSEKYLIKLIVLETIAANLGSMTTPVGNPQNLFICSFFSVDALSFFKTILPYSFLSAILILAIALFMLRTKEDVKKEEPEKIIFDSKKSAIYISLLFIALLAVFNVFPYQLLFIIEAAILLLFDRKVLKKIDYILLLTFVAFFIFSENMRNIEAVINLLAIPMEESPVLTSLIVSQVISNVPAAILLSPFANSFEGVLIGTDIGGLGTPIASLASLISLKIYYKRKGALKGYYMALFLALNIILLLILFLFSSLLS